MKKFNFAVCTSILMAFAGLANADAVFKSKEDVYGNWKLDYTQKTLNSEELLKREDSWSFKDNTVTITHIPREGKYYDQPPVNFEIDGGKLKVSMLGRPDKFETYSLLEKDEKSMTLKGKFGDIYHFLKK